MLKISLLFKKFTNFKGNNSRILGSKNAKFSGYCFCMKTNIYKDFQICIIVPLIVNSVLFQFGSYAREASLHFSENELKIMLVFRPQTCVLIY